MGTVVVLTVAAETAVRAHNVQRAMQPFPRTAVQVLRRLRPVANATDSVTVLATTPVRTAARNRSRVAPCVLASGAGHARKARRAVAITIRKAGSAPIPVGRRTVVRLSATILTGIGTGTGDGNLRKRPVVQPSGITHGHDGTFSSCDTHSMSCEGHRCRRTRRSGREADVGGGSSPAEIDRELSAKTVVPSRCRTSEPWLNTTAASAAHAPPCAASRHPAERTLSFGHRGRLAIHRIPAIPQPTEPRPTYFDL